MATTSIAKIDPIPVPASTDPAPRLPAWVGNFGDGTRENWQRNPDTGKHSYFLTLPQDQMPTAAQRVELENHKECLARLLELTPAESEVAAKKAFGLVAKMLLVLPARAAGPEATAAKIEAFEIALDDVPDWAIQIAIRKWFRGDCDNSFDYRNGSESFDYHWAPAPAELRRIALRETCELYRRIGMIDRILSAVPYQDHRALNAARD